MHYLALGDSISIDDYTGVPGGGAATQFARAISADPFQDRTGDGWTTQNVLEALPSIEGSPNVITLTIGGNDLLALLMQEDGTGISGKDILLIVSRIQDICIHLRKTYDATLILSTVYDPTDGDVRRLADVQLPAPVLQMLTELNVGIRLIARSCGARLCDLERLFHGHGFWSEDPWLTDIIEPNLAGAAAIAKHWQTLIP